MSLRLTHPRFVLVVLTFLWGATAGLLAQSRIEGSAEASDTGEPLSFATISLYQSGTDAPFTGTLTDIEGRFSIDAPPGGYEMVVSFVGYQSRRISLILTDTPWSFQEPLILYPDARMLEEVTVSSIRSLFRQDPDKRVYQMEDQILTQGATALELLETLPSIQIDEQGGISMRGSGQILILINGRPASMSGEDVESILARFPANSIKSVEIITNPSSQYDASGAGGIINIVLKSDGRRGLSGQAEASVGTRDKYTAGIQLQYGFPRAQTFLQYQRQHRNLFERGETRRIQPGGAFSPRLDQGFRTETLRVNDLLRAGMDFQPKDALRTGFYLQVQKNERRRDRRYNQQYSTLEGTPDSFYLRLLREDQMGMDREAGAYFQWDVDTSGQKLALQASLSGSTQDRLEGFDQRAFLGMEDIPYRIEEQRFARPRDHLTGIVQLDYHWPAWQLDGGIKGTMSSFDDRQQFEERRPWGWQEVDTISNSFRFREDVYAAYITHRTRAGALHIQAGLRAEWTLTQSLSARGAGEVINNYADLFPGIHLSYPVGEGRQWTASYTRRINRPNTWRLAPFYQIQDPLNLRLGNPWLQPERTDSYEVGYSQTFNTISFHGTLYHRATDQLITRVFYLNNDNAVVQFWQNASNSRASGLEIVQQFYLTRWLDLNVTGNAFHNQVNGEYNGLSWQNDNWSWNLNMMAALRMGRWGQVQLQGNYRGPMVLPQGEIEPQYGLNIGYRKDLLQRQATLSLNVTDILDTRDYRITTSDPAFRQFRQFKWETRIATLAFQYRFGGYRPADKKTKSEEGGGGDDGL